MLEEDGRNLIVLRVGLCMDIDEGMMFKFIIIIIIFWFFKNIFLYIVLGFLKLKCIDRRMLKLVV